MTLPETTCATMGMGHGGIEQLIWQEHLAHPAPGKAPVRLRARRLKKSDIDTRAG